MIRILKYAYLLIVLALGMFVTISCSDDKDNDDISLLLNGTSWIADDMDDNAIAYITFNNDGTGMKSDTKVPNVFREFRFYQKESYLRILDTETPLAEWEEYNILTLTEDKLVLQYTNTYGDTRTETFHSGETPSADTDNDYASTLVATWTVTMDDQSWKCIVTFKSNGTFTSKEYYDENGNGKYSSFEGTYTGTWKISGSKITITPSNDDSVMDFTGTIKSLTSSSGTFTDSDGWSIYLRK